ncbi:MAG: YwaF family protein [Clostridia bacterium]|nr:YwaF family protein [Clostridia bacterium]
MIKPEPYGIFHIVSFLLMVAAVAVLCALMKNSSEPAVSRMVLVAWIAIVVLEIYKQTVFTLEYENGSVTSDYQWYAFPFQFCSTPMYVLPFIAFLPDSKLRDGAIAFMSSFSLFAGLAVMLYPSDVFVSTIGINIQTMVHHSSQVILGVFFAIRYRKRLGFKYFLRGVAFYAVSVLAALALNFAVHAVLNANAIDETFNMFFISPYFECTLPVLGSIYTVVPYPVFLVIYVLGFTAAAALVLFAVLCAAKGGCLIYERLRTHT